MDLIVGLMGASLYGAWKGISHLWNKNVSKDVVERSVVKKDSKRMASADCVPSILEQIQCKPEVEKDDEDGQVDYTYQYQGQYFVINTLSDSTKARINYYNILSTPETDNSLLLELCNKFNWNEVPKAVFTHDEETKTLDVHLRLDVDIDNTDSFNKANIQSIMNVMFQCRNNFHHAFEHWKQEREKNQRTHIAGFCSDVK